MEMVMCRASRQILNELDKMAKQNGVQGLTVPAHLYICDTLVIKYHVPAIISVIKSRITAMPVKKRCSMHFTIAYWAPVIDNMLKGQAGACKDVEHDSVYGEMVDYNAFHHIIKMYLITDYSVQDAQYINWLVNTHTLDDVVKACKTALSNGVRQINYIKAVIDNEDAKKRVMEEKTKELGERIERSRLLISQDVHTHTPIDLARMEYDYEKKREDILLELLLNKMLGGSGK